MFHVQHPAKVVESKKNPCYIDWVFKFKLIEVKYNLNNILKSH